VEALSRRPRSIALLVGLVLVVTAAGLVAAFVPLVPCPSRLHVAPAFKTPCRRCRDQRQVTLWNKWFWRPTRVALLLIIEKSQSMAGRDLEIVKESCIAAAEHLCEGDAMGVLAFDDSSHRVVEFIEVERAQDIRQLLMPLHVGGGSNLQAALDEALQMFMLDSLAKHCRIKHAILVSTGNAPSANSEAVVRKMLQEGITVSTICVSGPTFDPVLMSQIAGWGAGRFTFTNNIANVPKLILNETHQVVAPFSSDAKKSTSCATPGAPPRYGPGY
jgi:hypothetical protein